MAQLKVEQSAVSIDSLLVQYSVQMKPTGAAVLLSVAQLTAVRQQACRDKLVLVCCSSQCDGGVCRLQDFDSMPAFSMRTKHPNTLL